MQIFGKRLGQTVSQCLDHDRVIVIVVALVFGNQVFDTYPRRHRERPDMIAYMYSG